MTSLIKTKNFTVKLNQLKNAEKYLISVYALNENTRGDSAEGIFITELCPPQKLFSPHQEDTAFELEWETINLAQYYKIKINPAPEDGYVRREVKLAHAYIESLVPGIQANCPRVFSRIFILGTVITVMV